MATIYRRRDRRQLLTGGMIFWAAIVSLYFLWEVVRYSGVMALLAEWQFNTFGHYYPSVTYLVLVTVLAAPGPLLLLRVRRRESTQRLGAATVRSAMLFRRVLLGLSAACLVGAIATLLMLLSLPSSVGTPRQVDLARPLVTLPAEGPTTLSGAILYDRTAVFNEDLLVVRRGLRLAPMVAPGARGTDLQFFVDLPPGAATAGGASSMTGILKKNALPGEIVQLFRYAGYRVEPPYYVLFSGVSAMRWPYFDLAAELSLVALLFLVLGLWQHRRLKWLEEAMRQRAEPTT